MLGAGATCAAPAAAVGGSTRRRVCALAAGQSELGHACHPGRLSPAGFRLKPRPLLPAAVQNSPVSDIGSSFYDAAVVSQTDKVTAANASGGHATHHYEYIYQKYLGHLNPRTPLRLLEIGLGYGMPPPHVAGSSLQVGPGRAAAGWCQPVAATVCCLSQTLLQRRCGLCLFCALPPAPPASACRCAHGRQCLAEQVASATARRAALERGLERACMALHGHAAVALPCAASAARCRAHPAPRAAAVLRRRLPAAAVACLLPQRRHQLHRIARGDCGGVPGGD